MVKSSVKEDFTVMLALEPTRHDSGMSVVVKSDDIHDGYCLSPGKYDVTIHKGDEVTPGTILSITKEDGKLVVRVSSEWGQTELTEETIGGYRFTFHTAL